jgi:hypothetical protein
VWSSPAAALKSTAAALALLLVASCRRAAPPAPDAASSSTASSISAQDPSQLPQTRDVPASSGTAFDARVVALWAAIVEDNPERAMPFFFPLGAYQQVKDIGDPAADWRLRLVAAYERDVHALHEWLGPDAPRATLIALEVPRESVRWVEPGEESNKIGYYRVVGSALRYEVDGAARTINVRTLISWRGEWYVVHLRTNRR